MRVGWIAMAPRTIGLFSTKLELKTVPPAVTLYDINPNVLVEGNEDDHDMD